MEALNLQSFEEYRLIQSVPSIGDKIAVTILSEIGDINEFENPKKVVAYAGLDPSAFESGLHKNPKLPLTRRERNKLRNAKVKLNEIHKLQLNDLTKILDATYERASFLIGLDTFQRIPSIGYELAQKLVNLGYYRLNQIKDENWAELFNRLEITLGCWTDPCVEDQIKCVIHHANYPGSERQWYDFTEDRKMYRQKFGYPKSRPKIPWYEI